jgi:hypothetical protein
LGTAAFLMLILNKLPPLRIADEIIPEKRLFYNDGMHRPGFEQA